MLYREAIESSLCGGERKKVRGGGGDLVLSLLRFVLKIVMAFVFVVAVTKGCL